MRPAGGHELPPELRRTQRRARRLEWVTLAYMISAAVVIFLTLGASQAMKAAFFEDLLSLLPPAAFLIADRVRTRDPDHRHPYGRHRAVSVGFLVSAVALLVMGLFLAYDSVEKLIRLDHPPIGTIAFLGREVWLGWLMIGALTYTLVPPLILGRLKIAPARDLHDKVLFADAEMNKADWMTAGAAIVGILGISVGLWWADAAAALFIAAGIVRDGRRYLSLATSDLMDRAPVSVEGDRVDPLPARVETELERLPWVKEARVRMREEGHVFFGEAFVLPADQRDLVGRIEDAVRELRKLDWRLHDLVITPVSGFEPEGEGEEAEAATAPAELGDVSP